MSFHIRIIYSRWQTAVKSEEADVICHREGLRWRRVAVAGHSQRRKDWLSDIIENWQGYTIHNRRLLMVFASLISLQFDFLQISRISVSLSRFCILLSLSLSRNEIWTRMIFRKCTLQKLLLWCLVINQLQCKKENARCMIRSVCEDLHMLEPGKFL